MLLVVTLPLLIAIRGILALTTTQTVTERQIEDKIPKHVPIKYKLKKEKEHAFKNLANDDWLSDFELEVTNIFNKPIYFLALGFIGLCQTAIQVTVGEPVSP